MPEKLPSEREGGMTEEVARVLKQKREERGLSPEDAEAATRIPAHYLRILEGRGDSRLLADALYLIPFLRSYSAFLGLDPALTVAQFIAAMQKGEAMGGPPPSKPGRSFPRVAVVFLILAGLAVLSFLWIAGEHG
jgi:cytoskeletal protein RodZ